MEADLSPSSGERYRRLSLWWDRLPGPIGVRPPLPGDLDVDVAVVGGGLHRPVDGVLPGRGRPDPAASPCSSATWSASAPRAGTAGGARPCSPRPRSGWTTPARPGIRGRPCAGPWRPPWRGGAGGRRRGHRVRLRPRGDGGAGPDRRPTRRGPATRSPRPGPGGRRGRPPAPVGRRGVGPGGGHRRPRAAPTPPTAPPSIPPGWCGVWPRPSSGGASPSTSRPRPRSIRPGAVETGRGTVRAATVVRATEGYTRTLRGEERTLVPVYSLMIATEPLPDEFWATSRAGRTGRPSPTTAT